ncbi:hypothetical protein BJ944DRAFT_181110 [Cunninghamella echinulata]|nr:hypothetical protein BJ944DRAFT_181110 [Cunninghamella echinulata]
MPNSGTSSASTYTTKMKLTDEGRPFAKDMFDLFAALIIQMQLSDHRTFFKSYPSSFTTDEASQCLKALKFTHVVKTADPANNGYQFTRTTTTFSMGKEMTKPLLQQFIQARLIINAAEPTNKVVKDKSIYYVTSKGKFMIQDFSERAHVSIQHMDQHLSTIASTQIVPLERISETDHLTFDRSNITACFKIMMTKIPLERILADDVGGLKHHHSPEEYAHTFYGYQCFEWISQFTSTVNKEEADMICGELVLYGWIAHILDKSDLSSNYYDDSILFRTSRNALYHITERGRIVLGWAEVSTNKSIASNGSGNIDGSSAHSFHHSQKTNFYGLSPSHHDYYNRPSSISNSETDVLTTTSEDVTAQLIRLRHILQDPLLRMYFRIYLKDNFCDENINFWLDYFAMRKKKKAQHTKNGLKDMLTDCYAIYDTYLKTNAPMEVNIDHALKYQIQQLVQSTFSVVSDQRSKATPFSSPAIAPPSNALLSTTTISVNSTSLGQCLNELMGLYDKVNDHLCRMMAQDSVPRFLRLEKYQTFFASHLPPINSNNNENNNNKSNKNNNNKNSNNSNGSSSTSSSSEGSIGSDTVIIEEKSSTLLDADNTTSQVTQLSIGINGLTCNGD